MASSSSSTSSSNGLDFAERVAQTHSNMSALPEQLCPPSRPSSPQAVSRVDGLKQAIVDAVSLANSNPTHPKWGHVTRMVRLHCTRRGYMGAAEGVRIGDAQRSNVPEIEWVLPETEEEWHAFEKRWGTRFERSVRASKYFANEEVHLESGEPVHASGKKAEIIRERVTTWQANVLPMDDTSSPSQPGPSVSTTTVNNSKNKASGNQNTLSQSSVGFSVVKRSVVAAKKLGRAASDDAISSKETTNLPKLSDDVQMLSPLARPVAPAITADPLPSSELIPVPGIAELPEMSFLPPSFPSQLRTSTPRESDKQKPPPIAPHPSSPISSPPPTRLVAAPTPSGPSSPLAAKAAKRRRGNSPRRSDAMDISHESFDRRKKARIDSTDSSLVARLPPSTPPAMTSSASGENASPSKVHDLGNAQGLPIPMTPERRVLPTLTDLLASSQRSMTRPRPRSRKTKGTSQARKPDDELPALDEADREFSPARTYFSSPASGSESPDTKPFRPRSPVSPLFSQNPNAFAPAFMSSQPGGLFGYGRTQGAPVTRAGSGILGMGYNSQFDVEGGINRAAELLDKDVDYADWLRDIPEAEEEMQPLKQSQGEMMT